MERKHLKVSIIIGILAFSFTLIILWLTTPYFVQHAIDSQGIAASPDDLPRGDIGVCNFCENVKHNLTLAKHWAKLSGFTLAIPQDYFALEIRFNKFIPVTSEPNSRLKVDKFTLYLTRGLLLTAQKSPPNFEGKVHTALSEGVKSTNTTAEIIRVKGNFGIHINTTLPKEMPWISSTTVRALVWVDGDTLFHLYGNAQEFSFDNLLKAAESIRTDR